MLNRIIDMFADLLKSIGLERLDPSLSTAASILTIAAALFSGIKLSYRCLCRLIQQKPIDRLYKALIAHSVVSRSEVDYQILSFIPPRFDNNKTFRQLLSQIKACSGEKQSAAAVFSVIGAPACGKTTTMRYLYCKLSKKRKCVYFQMQDVTNMDRLSDYLRKQKAENHFEDEASVIALFDGLDEAYAFFQEENLDSMEKAFQSIFFCGPDSKINGVFQKHNLNLDCVVVSLRPEFLERSMQSLTSLQHKNIYSMVYKILPLLKRDVIKIFKSLWILKRIESRRKEAEPRHQDRYPVWWKTPYYTWLLRRILKNNPGCLFHYPMYIRYAYAFMQEYKERESAGNRQAFSSNIAVSFDVLLNAIIKWEFHIYFENKSAEKNQKEMDQFKQQIEECSETIALKLLDSGERHLPKKQFKPIVEQYFKDDLGYLAMAHCFMVSDDEGMRFYFCHHTFYEYFLAKHLFEKANYHRRKELLYSKDASDYLRAMYYSILCQSKDLNSRITKSAKFMSRNLTLSDCHFLEKEGEMHIHDEPSISLVEILEYLPCINHFEYRGQDFTQEVLEDLIDCGNLDLSKTGWDFLCYAMGITPLERVKILSINGLPLCDVHTLKQYRDLKCLEMQYQSESDSILENILGTLSSLSLDWIHIESTNGSLCRKVHDCLRTGGLFAQRVFVKTPNYSQAHLELYHLNQEWKESGLPAPFYPSVRSNLEEAKKIFHSKDAKKDSEMLTAVFELEADEGGMLGLFDKNPEATYWNGMSLAAYYRAKDSIDEDQRASLLCRRLEPHIDKTNSEISVEFGYLYGKIQFFHSEYALADAWFTNTYCYAREQLSEEDIAECGIYLYRARIRAGNREELEILKQDVENRIKKLPEYQNGWAYAFFLKTYCADKLKAWQKGTPAPGSLEEALIHYRESAAIQYEHRGDFFDSFKSVYFELLYANRVENLDLGKRTLGKLSHALETYNEKPDTDVRNKQGFWIQYHEQLLYFALLTDDQECVLDTVEKLLNYPYRRGEMPLEKYNSIQQTYQEVNPSDIDRHLLWDTIWF